MVKRWLVVKLTRGEGFMTKSEKPAQEKIYHWFDRPCGARARTNNGLSCKKPAMRGKERCKLHGGMSTGPKTEAGKLKAAEANLKHGRYTKEALIDRERYRRMLAWAKDLDEIG